MKTIDFAIDLGTTNSLIAKQQSGNLEVYKNPIGHKETLPSVVGFRNDRILVGDKAREYLEKDPENVFGGFKRKMGTSETFFVKNLNAQKSPIELSSLVLKELKTFVYSEQSLGSVVITIPASFDTVQSNATKKAGFEAGFKEVVLLQEPIAACLAFANKGAESKQGKWLVYDLGGGTFDVAIVSITDAELQVIDHQGDNYLGGLDFDSMIVENIILKKLFQRSGFEKLKQQKEAQDISFKRLYYILLHKAEQAKKELSIRTQTEVEFIVENDQGDEVDMVLAVTREEFNECIAEKASYTIDLISNLLERNAINASDIQQVVLVGGSTYIPYIRELIESKLKISINASVDPTTAVVVGAAQYASTKRCEISVDVADGEQVEKKQNKGMRVKTSYLRTSMDMEEMLMATVEGNLPNLHYRIQREDGGYDSGLKKMNEKIREYLSLAAGQVNRFQLKFYNDKQELVDADVEPIEIIQGKYNVHGQPLPNDICLEVDDLEERATRLELIFARNSVLPLKKTIYREVSKTIYKDAQDKLIVSILEGEHFASPSTNQVIGLIEINPAELNADLVRGSDLEIKLEITESRDLHVNVYLSLTDQEFKNVFHSSERYVSESKLTEEVEILISQLRKDIRQHESNENYEMAGKMDAFLQEAMTIREGLHSLATTLNSDAKYHLQERKRKLAQKYDQTGKSGKVTHARLRYFECKESVQQEFSDSSIKEKFERQFQNVIKDEQQFITSQSITLIESKTRQLNEILNEIRFNSKEYLIHIFHILCGMLNEFTDKEKAKLFIEQGEKALERQNYSELKVVNLNLLHLLPDRGEKYKHFKGTGIG